MLQFFEKWYHEIFAKEEALILALLLVIGLVIIVTMGAVLAPFIASAIFAFLLQGAMGNLQRYGVPRAIALAVTYVLFVSVFVIGLLGVLPLVWNQLVALFAELPRMLAAVQEGLKSLPAAYPTLVSEAQVVEWSTMANEEVTRLGQWTVQYFLANIPNLVGVMIYLILVPILVFFMLKDRDQILGWCASFLPDERPLMNQIWQEMNIQVANYARGKAIEILVVGVVSYVTFAAFGLNYAALLGLLVGLSVVIPYIGAAVVTLPVVLVAFFQWGWSNEFAYVVFAYLIIQALDGNVLVPLLFSEAVNLHPIAIILAVLVFGGFWGFWGVFFAIPLATLIKALIYAWPRNAPSQPAT